MTTEDKLKSYILTKYKSVREFTQSIEMPYSTIATIFKRGVDNASVTTIIKICHALNISTDSLAEGKIVPLDLPSLDPVKLEDIFADTKQAIRNADVLTIGGDIATPADIDAVVRSLDTIIALQKNYVAFARKEGER